MMLRGVLNGRFRQLSGKKDLDPMRERVVLQGLCQHRRQGERPLTCHVSPNSGLRLPQGSER